MVLAENIAHDPGAFDIWPVPHIVRFVHREQDPAVDRFEAVADVRKRPSHDHAHRVIEVGMPHFGFQAYWKGFFCELLHQEDGSLSWESDEKRGGSGRRDDGGRSASRRPRPGPRRLRRKMANFITTVVFPRHFATH